MRRFVHSFWTKPCENDNEKLKKYILYFATSLAWLKKNNFPIVLHTDSKGKEVFKDLPYDEIYTTLDNIPENINPKFYAYGKFLAMQQEELGSVHIDGDVFIKTKELGDRILNFKSDLITQSTEPERVVKRFYRRWDFDKELIKDLIDLDTNTAYNCGIIGFNNKEFRDKYYNTYFKLVDILPEFKHPLAIPDLVCEQLLLFYLYPNQETLFNGEITLSEAHKIGYLHIPSSTKMLPEYIECLKRMLQNLNSNIYNICQNI